MEIGDVAPDFTLPGTDGDVITEYTLSHYTDDGAVVLLFYPFDFSPVCTEQLCAFRDAEFLELTPAVDVFGVSTDSVYAHREFSFQFDLPFPLLSDNGGTVSDGYGLRYDDLEQHEAVSMRALVVVGGDRRVEYVWTAEDVTTEFDVELLEDVRASVDAFPKRTDGRTDR